MKNNLFNVSTLLGAVAGFSGAVGMFYTANKDAETKKYLSTKHYEIKAMEDKRDWERIEIEKYKLNLPSKFDNPQPTPNKVNTPVSDYLDTKLNKPSVLDNIHDLDNKFKDGPNAPFEKFFFNSYHNVDYEYDYINLISPEMINYAGLTILGCVVAITSALIILYMNNLVINQSEKYFQDKSPVLLKLFNLYKNSINISSGILKVFIAAFYLLMVSTCCYMITL